jgi:hypothetical protein
MEFLSFLLDIAREGFKWLPSSEINQKEIRIFGSLLLSFSLVIGIGLSSYFLIDSFQKGLLLKQFLWIGLGINAVTALSVGFIIPHLWIKESKAYTQENEEILKAELDSVIALFLLSLLPGLHILFLPRVIAQASNILEQAGSTSQTTRYKKIACNVITISVIMMMLYTLLIGLIIIIVGDTR